MNILKEVPTTDYLIVPSRDVFDTAETSGPEVKSNDNTIAEEDPSYYFQDVIFLVCNTRFLHQLRSVTLPLG
jgi:hypothetical protein